MAIIVEADVMADLDTQGVPDAADLARIASDLNLDHDDIWDGAQYDAAKIRLLGEELLRVGLGRWRARDPGHDIAEDL